MHFITYEQRRRSISLTMEGESCDEECQTVYPEWPNSASYDAAGKEWQYVHVKTKLLNATKKTHPAMADELNVVMQKPTVVGDMCRCYSFENVFNPGVEKLSLTLTHGYEALLANKEGSSRETTILDPDSYFMTDDGNVFRHIPKGNQVTFTLEEVLAAFGTCMDCQPTSAFATNSLCPEGICPDPFQPKPVPRVSGTTVEVRTEYYNNPLDLPKDIRGYDKIKDMLPNGVEAFSIHVFSQLQDWTSRGSDNQIQEMTDTRTVETDNYRYGTMLKVGRAG